MKYSLSLLFFISTIVLPAQEDDHINWSFNRYSFTLKDDWKMDVTPIFRINNNFTNFSSASIDFSLKRSFNHGITLGVVARSWYFPGRKIRQFFWIDLIQKLPDFDLPIIAKHRLRFHGGVDVPDWKGDGDFIRYFLSFVGNFDNSKIQPMFAIEPFYRLNMKNYVERFRIEYGFQVKANKNLKFFLFMRQQEMYNFEEAYTQFLWMSGIQYFFNNPIMKEKEIH